jgi:hypothetical protein
LLSARQRRRAINASTIKPGLRITMQMARKIAIQVIITDCGQ